MEHRAETTCRMAVRQDAQPLSVLATRVFLDPYAIQGIRSAIARESRCFLSEEAFAEHLTRTRRGILVAEPRQGAAHPAFHQAARAAGTVPATCQPVGHTSLSGRRAVAFLARPFRPPRDGSSVSIPGRCPGLSQSDPSGLKPT